MAALKTIHGGIDFGEGPRWHEGRLWFSDFFRRGVYTLDDDGQEELQLRIDDRPSGLGWLPDGTLLVVAMTSRQVLAVDANGDVSQYADLQGLADGYCNDMVVSERGDAYVGNFGFDMENGAPFRSASIAHVRLDGSATVAADDLMFPNGSVITPDGSTLIVGETWGGRYTAWDIAGDGSLGNKRLWAQVEGSTPDGCCLDAEGAIWMADFMGGRVARVLEGGEITDMIEVDGRAVACVLGGDDRRTLYVLQSPDSVPEQVSGKGLSTIGSVRVDVPGAGRP